MNQQVILDKINGTLVVGVDEVGRGAWAGPLVVGVVMLEEPIIGLTDSKLLTANQRNLLAIEIKSKANVCTTGWVWPDEVDALGLTAATTLAIERAISDLDEYDYILIDGVVNFLPDNPRTLLLAKADALVPAVSAASIIAKVARDQYMADQALQYPVYGFERHVGYGTAQHRQALADHGISIHHRRSYKPIQQYIAWSGRA